MDPQTTLQLIIDAAVVDGDADATYEAMRNMHEWLRIGGACPDAVCLGHTIIVCRPGSPGWSYLLARDVFSAVHTGTREEMRWSLPMPGVL